MLNKKGNYTIGSNGFRQLISFKIFMWIFRINRKILLRTKDIS